ncbi:MAG: hypothetical protein JJT89_18460, partial [Nitriliruptoraceae bacterium]|nr:hypothetical protein [Nitriliruptoraceae bacterium]
MTVRPARVPETQATAAVHAALLTGLFVSLGRGFLRAYHASFLSSPHAVVLVALPVAPRDGVRVTPNGFLVGTLDNEAHYRWLARARSVLLVLVAGRALIIRPRLAARVVRTRGARYARALLRRLRPHRLLPDARPAAADGSHGDGAGPAPGPIAV